MGVVRSEVSCGSHRCVAVKEEISRGTGGGDDCSYARVYEGKTGVSAEAEILGRLKAAQHRIVCSFTALVQSRVGSESGQSRCQSQ